jgi:ABC-type transport system involved in cytochrome c biogenesis permease subunit
MDKLLFAPPSILIAIGCYLISSFSFAMPEKIRKWILIILIVGFTFITYTIGLRWVEAGRAPFQTLYESLIFFSWCIVCVYLVLRYFYKIGFLLPFVSQVTLLVLGYALFNLDTEISALPPALQSIWFVPHVVTYFLAYSLLALAAVSSIISLNISDLNLPFKKQAISFSYTVTQLGFTFLTFGMITGAIWGKDAWGDYWTWDPKENWALISWLMYLLVMHTFFIPKWREKMFMWLNIVAFAVILFTYLGINLLPTASSSMHVYK